MGLATDRWKQSVDDYVLSAKRLLSSIRANGIIHPVRVDPEGELLNGSHRVACALALGMDEIPVVHETRRVWAPPWNEAWFIDHGMMLDDLERLRADWELMRQ